ncbi:unnamed protein product, partial [Cylicostephanus goldi]
MIAAQEEFADQSAMLARAEDIQSLQYITKQKQETAEMAEMKATEEHRVELGVDKAKEEQTEADSKLLVNVAKVEDTLKLQETKDEAAAAIIRTTESEVEAQTTLKSRAMEIERTIKDVVAAAEVVAEATCEFSIKPTGDTSKTVGDRVEASELRHLEISEEQQLVVLEQPSQTAAVVGEKTYHQQEQQRGEAREYGSERQMHTLSLARIEAPKSQVEQQEVTQKLARTLVLEKKMQAVQEDAAALTTTLTAQTEHIQVQKEVAELQRAKSVENLRAVTEEKSILEKQLSQSQSELYAQGHFRDSRHEEVSSQSYKEFVSEAQGLTTQWDIIETDQTALICWKDTDQQSSQLLAKAVTLEDIGTTLDLTVRRPSQGKELQLPLDSQDSAERQLSVDRTQTSFSLQKSDSTSLVQQVMADKAQTEESGMFHEFGKEETVTVGEFGKLRAK